jgi:hypothetical protein
MFQYWDRWQVVYFHCPVGLRKMEFLRNNNNLTSQHWCGCEGHGRRPSITYYLMPDTITSPIPRICADKDLTY